MTKSVIVVIILKSLRRFAVTIEMMIATTLWIATMTIAALIQTVAIAPLEQAKIVDKETVRAMR